MKIITGHTGTNHVESDDDRYLHAGIFGKGSYVLNTGTKLNAEIVTSNIIRIGSGDIMHQGTHARIPYGEHEDVNIENGTTGYKRIDCIYAVYRKSGKIESMELKVVKGTPDTSNPATPGYADDYNILYGDVFSPMLLYIVELDGVNIVNLTKKFQIATGLDDVYRKSSAFGKGDVLKLSFDALEVSAKGTAELTFTDNKINDNAVYLGFGFTKSGTNFLYHEDGFKSQSVLDYSVKIHYVSVSSNKITVSFINNNDYDLTISGWIKMLCV